MLEVSSCNSQVKHHCWLSHLIAQYDTIMDRSGVKHVFVQSNSTYRSSESKVAPAIWSLDVEYLVIPRSSKYYFVIAICWFCSNRQFIIFKFILKHWLIFLIAKKELNLAPIINLAKLVRAYFKCWVSTAQWAKGMWSVNLRFPNFEFKAPLDSFWTLFGAY